MAPLSSQRFHGRNGRILVGVTTSAAASPIAYGSSFTIDSSTDRADATAFGDKNKKALAGLPGGKGAMSGFSDVAGDSLYTASVDGLPRKTYFYKDFVNAVGEYFFTTAFWDITLTVPVGGAATISGNWTADSDLIEVLPA